MRKEWTSGPGRKMQIMITSGIAEGETEMGAFDKALTQAGIADYNLIGLSSIIPAGSELIRSEFAPGKVEYGDRLYIVMAKRLERAKGKAAWAGLGWVQQAGTGKGLFAEQGGESRASVARSIQTSLGEMIASRNWQSEAVCSEVVGIKCVGKPVCALVVAVYQGASWGAV